tara:strand:+ start:39 stop:518 length:480 start_codon:yes stop_codon:yes gene_type:complete
MSTKLLNMNIGATAGTEIPTLVNITDVQTIVMPTPVGAAAAVLTITYKNASTCVITTQAQGVGAGSPTAAQCANIVKGFWDTIVAAIAQPWNMPVYPSQSKVWDQTYLQASSVLPQEAQGTNPKNTALNASVLSGKVSAQMLATDGVAATAPVVFVSVV